MTKYYTRACNFYYGENAKLLINKKLALPLCGNKYIAFDKLEIITRKNYKVLSKTIYFKKINRLKSSCKKKVKQDLKKIILKRKNFLKNVNFLKPSIMGILNLTPDSFSDGGKYNNQNKAKIHISKMIKSGANIIDVGGESTRPGSKTVLADMEWKRVKNVIKNFKKKHHKVCLSIDTRKSEIMIKSIKEGTDLINDVSGFNYDKQSLLRLKKFNVSKVLHHMQGTPNTMQRNPKYRNVLLDIYDFFEKGIKKIHNKKIIIDPGIGFGKNLKHNLTLISKISLFHSLGFPILIGTSRKRFISQISGLNDSTERIGGTIASVLFLLSQGVQIFRVHNVNEVKQGISVFRKILTKLKN
ncbi:MAG: dihydropteroate synthase [Pelagibacteraceae bacterium]|nr:dihydropteroate synthase [Pelagibacteraceae bacterium]|tara:strand:+ start:7064 stop:8131 length:1068 start_codon:yes stop_codon:yes gene_type:complete